MTEPSNVAEPTINAPNQERRFSLVWVIPVVAVIVSLFIYWQSFADRGPLIEITFESAQGIEAGKTTIRHKDVDIGVVEEVTLSDDLKRVKISARMENVVAPYLGETTKFWVVRPRISGTQVSGVDTLLSGVYIQAAWEDKPAARQWSFEGLEEPPQTPLGTPGRRVVLQADSAGSVGVGSPVYFRQIEVGRIEKRRLSDDSRHVLFEAFIEAPYHEQLNGGTRFWNASGFEVNLGTEGLAVQVESVQALLAGGVSFEPIGAGISEPITEDGRKYRLYASRDEAADALFEDLDSEEFRFIAIFAGTVRGLRNGAPIEYRGIRVGKVGDIVFDAGPTPEESRIYAVLQLQPSRLGLTDIGLEDFRQIFSDLVERGLRVRLAAGSLLTGALYVELVDKPEEPAAAIDFTTSPYPALPTLPSNMEALTGDVETLVQKLSSLPLEDLIVSATALLKNANKLLDDPALEQAPEKVMVMLEALAKASGNADALLAGMAPGSEVYVELNGLLRELRVTARSISALAEKLEQNPNALITGR